MLRILEIAWLVIAVTGLILGVVKWLTEGFSAAIWFFLFSSIASLFWMLRRRQRIRMKSNIGGEV